MAPLEIGADSYIGAGSVITEAVPPGALAVGRGRQVNKPGWVAKRKERRISEPGSVLRETSRKAEEEAILEALRRSKWNRKLAAVLLKIDYRTLLLKMKKLSIEERAEELAKERSKVSPSKR